MQLQLKFKQSASAAAREGVVAKLTSGGAHKVDPLFPDSPDEFLRSIYVVDADDGREDLLQLLQAEEAVETAEQGAPRYLA